MEYFKINDTDISLYVNELNIETVSNYNAQTNAAGNTVVDFINQKRSIEVGIIPLDEETASNILNLVKQFQVLISYRDPKTKQLETNVNCIIPDEEISYYTIQQNKIMLNGFSLTFTEL